MRGLDEMNAGCESTYDQEFVNQLHLRFEKHDENEWQIRDEIDQNAAQRGQIGLLEARTDQVPETGISD